MHGLPRSIILHGSQGNLFRYSLLSQPFDIFWLTSLIDFLGIYFQGAVMVVALEYEIGEGSVIGKWRKEGVRRQ